MSSSTQVTESSPVGYRFHPTDVELVDYYLKSKRSRKNNPDIALIAEINLCQFEPWELPGLSLIESSDKTWYYFGLRDRKYAKSNRSNRTTKTGFWKPTGDPRNVMTKRPKRQIGTKRTLVFHKGRSAKGIRTEWIITEYKYIIDSNLPNQEDYVLYKLKSGSHGKKNNKGCVCDNLIPTSDYENQNCHMASSGLPGDNSCPSHCGTSTSGYENQNHPQVTPTSDYENQNHLVVTPTSDYENQNRSEVTSTFDYENQNHYGVILTSEYEDQNRSEVILTSGYENQNHYKIISTSDYEDQNRSEVTLTSGYENQNHYKIISTSDYEDQNFQKVAPCGTIEPSYLISLTSGYKNQNSMELSHVTIQDNGESSCLRASDSNYQDYILASEVGEGSTPTSMPNFGYLNQDWTQLLAYDKDFNSNLSNFSSQQLKEVNPTSLDHYQITPQAPTENNSADITYLELGPQQWDDLLKLSELQDTLNPLPLGPAWSLPELVQEPYL